jgi:hypothetical protein
VTLHASSTAALSPPAPAASAQPSELRTVWGVILGGSLNGDVIIASPEALAIVKAGLLVRAFVIAGMEMIKRTVAIGNGRKIALEFGVYRAVR